MTNEQPKIRMMPLTPPSLSAYPCVRAQGHQVRIDALDRRDNRGTLRQSPTRVMLFNARESPPYLEDASRRAFVTGARFRLPVYHRDPSTGWP